MIDRTIVDNSWVDRTIFSRARTFRRRGVRTSHAGITVDRTIIASITVVRTEVNRTRVIITSE